MQKFCAVLFVICFGCSAWAAHPFQVEDMQKFSRLGDPQISPDGKWIAFVVQKKQCRKEQVLYKPLDHAGHWRRSAPVDLCRKGHKRAAAVELGFAPDLLPERPH